jgi:hypothetical protein
VQGQRQHIGSCGRSQPAKTESAGCRGWGGTGSDRGTFDFTACGGNWRGAQFDCENSSERGFFARTVTHARITENDGVIRYGRRAQAQLCG